MKLSARNLSTADIRALNRLLVPQGRKMCACCAGTFNLTEQYWYLYSPTKRPRSYWSTDCRACTLAAKLRQMRTAYRKQADVRKRKIAQGTGWNAAHADEHAAIRRKSYHRRKRDHFREAIYGE